MVVAMVQIDDTIQIMDEDTDSQLNSVFGMEMETVTTFEIENDNHALQLTKVNLERGSLTDMYAKKGRYKLIRFTDTE